MVPVFSGHGNTGILIFITIGKLQLAKLMFCGDGIFFVILPIEMSKNALKKELALMSKEQLEQLVLEAYSARKEIRAYLEFFMAPDPDKLFEKTADSLANECRRTKWGYSKARISVIRRLLSDFASYQPGDDYVSRLELRVIELLLVMSHRVRMGDALTRGFGRLVSDCVHAADAAGRLTPVADVLKRYMDSGVGSSVFRRMIADAMR